MGSNFQQIRHTQKKEHAILFFVHFKVKRNWFKKLIDQQKKGKKNSDLQTKSLLREGRVLLFFVVSFPSFFSRIHNHQHNKKQKRKTTHTHTHKMSRRLLWPLLLVLTAVVSCTSSELKCNACVQATLELKHEVEVWMYQPLSSIVLSYAIGIKNNIPFCT